jgi:hypothetical protein
MSAEKRGDAASTDHLTLKGWSDRHAGAAFTLGTGSGPTRPQTGEYEQRRSVRMGTPSAPAAFRDAEGQPFASDALR